MKTEQAVPRCGLYYKREGAQVPLQGVEVTGELLGGHARVRVRQRYRNAESRPVEAVYVFPLPSDGTLTAFSMECNGRKVQGVVKEREEAFRTYDDAITDGHGAALLDQERPNVFTAQVGNLLPNEETLVEVEFLQAIQVEEGTVRWMLPTLVAPALHPRLAAGRPHRAWLGEPHRPGAGRGPYYSADWPGGLRPEDGPAGGPGPRGGGGEPLARDHPGARTATRSA